MKETGSRRKIVVFGDDSTKSSFDKLKEGKYEDRFLHNCIGRALDDIYGNPTCGIKLPRRLWPKSYLIKFSITNLWKYD
ncbi:MAG: hypothetical protein WC602_01035 [archaeon]